jgi:hypothetical protein
MNQRSFIDRLLSPAGFGLVLLLFLLPFVTMSCGVNSPTSENLPAYQFDATFTGVDLLVGGSPDISDTINQNLGGEDSTTATEEDEDAAVAAFDERYGRYYPPQPLILAAAAVIFAGMIVGLVAPAVRRAWLSVAAAVLAVVLLAVEIFVIAPSVADDAVADGLGDLAGPDAALPPGAIDYGTSPASGFWVVVAILLGLAAWQAYVALRQTPPTAQAPTAQAPTADASGQPPPATAWPPLPAAGGPAPGAPQ